MSLSLVQSVKMLMGREQRELSPEEIKSLGDFQRAHQVDDSDPLILVYALMAKNQVVADTLPNLLQQKITETIEMHRQTLREQSTVIAKELITAIALDIEAVNVNVKTRWTRYAIAFLAGLVMGAAIIGTLWLLKR